mmetsp:Transcript_22637/g.33844  ORF Transcript_22637/g.33844 Transcript_22637/m.33844 type:complete len:561 (+) Transcript_22637:53-1735(+)
MKRPITNNITNTNSNINTSTPISTNSGSGGGQKRVTRISHLRKGQQQKKSKPNPCVLMTGVITTILMTFIYLVTSSMHRTMMEENAAYEEQQMRLYQQQQQQQQQQQAQLQAQYHGSHGNSNGHGHGHTTPGQMLNSSPKFITVVLPSVVNPQGRQKRLASIAKTWGPNSNAIFITHEDGEYDAHAHDGKGQTDHGVGGGGGVSVGGSAGNSNGETKHRDRNAEQLGVNGNALGEEEEEEEDEFTSLYPQVLKVPQSVATVDEGVPRLHYVMETIVQKYNPDYAFFVNDHTFVIPQHMCTFLQKYGGGSTGGDGDMNSGSGNTHLYAGHALKPKGPPYAFNSGAAGYFLSRETMKSILQKQNQDDLDLDGNEKQHEHEQETTDSQECKGERKWLQGNPGLVTANCLKKTMGLDPIDTRDELGRHVFHAYGIVRTVKGDFDSWYISKHETLNEIWGEDEKFHYELKSGKECCSPQTISFHYVEFAETMALHATLQKILNVGGPSNISNDELQKFMLSVWPTEKRDIGGYSHNLPPLGKEDIWDDLLHVVKSIAPTVPFTGC